MVPAPSTSGSGIPVAASGPVSSEAAQPPRLEAMFAALLAELAGGGTGSEVDTGATESNEHSTTAIAATIPAMPGPHRLRRSEPKAVVASGEAVVNMTLPASPQRETATAGPLDSSPPESTSSTGEVTENAVVEPPRNTCLAPAGATKPRKELVEGFAPMARVPSPNHGWSHAGAVTGAPRSSASSETRAVAGSKSDSSRKNGRPDRELTMKQPLVDLLPAPTEQMTVIAPVGQDADTATQQVSIEPAPEIGPLSQTSLGFASGSSDRTKISVRGSRPPGIQIPIAIDQQGSGNPPDPVEVGLPASSDRSEEITQTAASVPAAPAAKALPGHTREAATELRAVAHRDTEPAIPEDPRRDRHVPRRTGRPLPGRWCGRW